MASNSALAVCHSEQSEELSLERSEKSSTRDINAVQV